MSKLKFILFIILSLSISGCFMFSKKNKKVSSSNSVSCVRNITYDKKDEFIVEIIVMKGSVVGFTKLLEYLPKGFTATEIESVGGIFSFLPNTYTEFIWSEAPLHPKFKVAYKVKINPEVNGQQVIEGRYVYVENNEKRTFEIEKSILTIKDGKIETVKH